MSHRYGPAGVAAGRTRVSPSAYPIPIAGHGDRSTARAEADALEINAALLTDGESRCLLMSFDLLYIGGSLERRLREALAERYGLRNADVLLFASHTHFAPPTDPALPALGPVNEQYADHVFTEALRLVDHLIATRPVPITIETRRGDLDHSVNRRRPRFLPTYTRSGGLSTARVSLAPNAAGARNETVTVVMLCEHVSNKAIAMIWNYACHPVGHTPSDVTSADFPGFVRAKLRHEVRDLPVLFMQGFCGDVRPDISPSMAASWRQAAARCIKQLASGTPWLGVTPESWQRWAETLSQRVKDIAEAPPVSVDNEPMFSSELTTISVDAFFDGDAQKTAMEVRGLRLGRDVEIVAFGAEPSVGWVRRLDERLGPSRAVRLYAGYCGDVVGYLPLPEQVSEGGYEVVQSQRLFGLKGRYRPSALATVVEDAVESLVRALRADQANS
jgi:hypothetical protein